MCDKNELNFYIIFKRLYTKKSEVFWADWNYITGIYVEHICVKKTGYVCKNELNF
jgi:hypothetical protein